MPTNQEIADKLREVYHLMQLAGENRFRAIAFDRAAQTVEGLSEQIDRFIETNSLTNLKGIGRGIAEELYTYAETGSMPVLEDLKERVPEELVRWLDISGLGPKNILKIHRELGITDIGELKKACREGKVATLSGLGAKSEEKILKSIEWLEQFGERCRLDEALEVAVPILDYLKTLDGVQQIEIAGSLRRANETIGDIDILIGAEEKDVSAIFDAFVEHSFVLDVLGRGETKCSIRTEGGRQVDLRIVKPKQYPAALMYFTGSKEHNVALRQRARERGLALNEYGIFNLDGEGNTDFNRPELFHSEEDIYKKLDLYFIPPELREDHGEME
ncbi:MAG: helix-hairpin-helix domain-containing protein, partial [Balneolaceae bacterium]